MASLHGRLFVFWRGNSSQRVAQRDYDVHRLMIECSRVRNTIWWNINMSVVFMFFHWFLQSNFSDFQVFYNGFLSGYSVIFRFLQLFLQWIFIASMIQPSDIELNEAVLSQLGHQVAVAVLGPWEMFESRRVSFYFVWVILSSVFRLFQGAKNNLKNRNRRSQQRGFSFFSIQISWGFPQLFIAELSGDLVEKGQGQGQGHWLQLFMLRAKITECWIVRGLY